MGDSVLYANSGAIPGASRLAWRARRLVFESFLGALGPTEADSILDIGVTSDSQYRESNFFERFYPHKHRITCVGTEDGSHLEAEYPGISFTRVRAHEPLPFPSKHFKIAFSNAVIEHAGSRKQQQAFLGEMLRVSERFFLATPNRWFAVETHTGLPLVHYLPAPVFRRTLRAAGYGFWADEQNLNLLSKADLRRLFPPGARPSVDLAGVGWGACRSNVVAYGRSDGGVE